MQESIPEEMEIALVGPCRPWDDEKPTQGFENRCDTLLGIQTTSKKF